MNLKSKIKNQEEYGVEHSLTQNFTTTPTLQVTIFNIHYSCAYVQRQSYRNRRIIRLLDCCNFHLFNQIITSGNPSILAHHTTFEDCAKQTTGAGQIEIHCYCFWQPRQAGY